jgi:hypothetical protein
MSSIERYWPETDAIEKCFRVEAEVADETTLLAVHQKMPIARKSVTTEGIVEASEESFLEDFLEDDLPSGIKVTLVEGKSGAGKSHLIRWLDAQLAMREDRRRRHVIRIPKSASLRSVVEAILENLEGEVYNKLRSELSSAVEEMAVEDTAERLVAELQIGLAHKAKEIQHRRDRADLGRLGQCRRMPHLLTDMTFRSHGLDAVLQRIVRRSLEGSREFSRESGLVELEENIFLSSDFDFGNEIPLDNASMDSRSYYITVLQRADGVDRVEAVAVLNEVLDGALSRVFRLQEMGGGSLQDIILEIRRSLLREGRELVLLIEDFAALSGVKDSLLRVCIHEAIRDNRQELCVMRTAIAVTDGDMAHRDTILTRAKHTWIVQTECGDEEATFTRIENLVGAYLNAARHGHAGLARLRESDEWDLIGGDVPIWDDGTVDDAGLQVLSAFGRTAAGVSLFPFNATAIRVLAEANLRRAGRLEYNPRSIINHVLREITKRRREYMAGEFPQPVANVSPSGPVANYVTRMELSRGESDRMKTLLAVWGGNPNHQEELLRIDARLGVPFNLELKGMEVRPGPQPGGPVPPVAVQPPQVPPGADRITEWIRVLEAWVAGTELIQTKANDLRVAIAEFLNNRIEWGALCVSGYRIEHRAVFLPNARGASPGSAIVVRLTETPDDPEGSMRAALAALLRMRQFESMAYPEAPEDIVRLATFFDPIVADAEAQIRDLAAGIVVEAISRLQCCSTVLLGPPEDERSVACVAQHCWRGASATTSADWSVKWGEYRIKISAMAQDLMKLVQKWSGFSRGGERVYGIAVERIMFVEMQPWPKAPSELPDILRVNSPNRLETAHLDSRRVIPAVTAEWNHKSNELEPLTRFADDDIRATLEMVKSIAFQAQNAGIWRNGPIASCDEFVEHVDGLDADQVEAIRALQAGFPAPLNDESLNAALRIINSECFRNSNTIVETLREIVEVVNSLDSTVAERERQVASLSTVDALVAQFLNEIQCTEYELERYRGYEQ